MEATELSDCSQIIKTFEKALLAAPSEEAVIGGILPKVTSISAGAGATAKNLQDLASPPIPDAVNSLFASAAGEVELPKVDIPTGLQDNANQLVDVKNWREWIEECIPCGSRITFRSDLVNVINGQFLLTLEQLANAYLKQLSFIINILNMPDVYQDACLLLKAFDSVCIPDLQRMLSLFAQMLYRLTSAEIQNLDLMKLLIIPIFQPLFAGVAGLFMQYRAMVTDPLQCVATHMGFQLEKLKTGDFLNNPYMTRVIDKTLDLDDPATVTALNTARGTFDSWDDAIENVQNTAGTAAFHARRLLNLGIQEVEFKADEMLRELQSFLGVNEGESQAFLLAQFDKILLLRLIGFISSLIKAFSQGFKCKLDSPDAAQHTLAQFLDRYLGPDSPVIVQVDPNTQDIKLFLDRAYLEPFNLAQENPVQLIATGNADVDQAVNAIIKQNKEPVSVTPSCFLQSSDEDNNKLAEFIDALNSREA